MPNFMLSGKFRFFGPNLPKKGILGPKQKDAKFILNRQFWFFGLNLPRKSYFGPKQNKWTSPSNYNSIHCLIILFFGHVMQKKYFVSKLTPIFQNCFKYHEILFKKFASPFHSLKMIFKIDKKVRMTHINISVAVNAAEILGS